MAERITGFNKSKKPNLWVGGIKSEDLGGLIGIIKEAKQLGKGITFFLWKNDPTKYPDAPPLTLQAIVAEEREQPQSRSQQKRFFAQQGKPAAKPAPVADEFGDNVVDELDL